MKTARKLALAPAQRRLFNFLVSEFHNPAQVFELVNEFLAHRSYDKSFCRKLIALGKQRTGVPWNIRRLATLILENQILKVDPEDLNTFDALLVQLNLKQPGLHRPLVNSVLKEG
jgi:hypothetical protein